MNFLIWNIFYSFSVTVIIAILTAMLGACGETCKPLMAPFAILAAFGPVIYLMYVAYHMGQVDIWGMRKL